MFSRSKPGSPAWDLDQLSGDPWQVGNISDAPNPAEREHWLSEYDRHVEAALAHAGIGPDHPEYDAHLRAAIEADQTHSVDPMSHGHELPMTKRNAIAYAPETVFREQAAAGEQSAALLRAYQARNPDLADDLDGMSNAISAAMEYAAERGEEPLRNPAKFLNDVSAFHRAGLRPQYGGDHGRTAGVGSGSGLARHTLPGPTFDHPDDDDGMVGELRDLQRRGGFY
jgi:hypothetical protein